MEELGLSIFEKYGLIGLSVTACLMFCGWIVHRILSHFMREAVRKDGQVVQMQEMVTRSIDANTKAITELSLGLQKLSILIEEGKHGFDRYSAQNREEHAQILEFVRQTKAR